MPRADRLLQPIHPGLSDEFRRMADDLVREANGLGSMLAPPTRNGIAELIALINAYYSNLIEGHYTFPRDIERGLADEWADDDDARDYQVEGAAHVQVERIVKRALAEDPDLDPASVDFLAWVHRLFYERLPARFRVIETPGGRTLTVEPGELRTKGVIVGRHPTPDVEDLDLMLRAFEDAYRIDELHHPENLAAVFAAHHRLLWIQPFLDGNGRVARIMTQAHLYRLGLSGSGMWSLPRGLARAESQYKQCLSAADGSRPEERPASVRQAEEELTRFCEFMADTALEQVRFMGRKLDFETFERRIRRFVDDDPDLKPEIADLLWDMALRGRVPRSELPRLLGISERSARNVSRTLLDRGLVQASTHRAPLRLAFPADAAEVYFPRLFPAAAGA
jgi:Fic family protein